MAEIVEPSRTDSVMHYRPRLGIWRCPDYDAVERLIADPRASVSLYRDLFQIETGLVLCPEIPDASTHAPGAERGHAAKGWEVPVFETQPRSPAPAYSPAVRALALGVLVAVGAGLLATRAVRRGMEGVGR